MIPTIKVKREGGRGYHIINKSEYDPKVHVIVTDDPLDHDGDGKKGGSLPADETVVEVVKPKRRRRKTG